MAHGNEVPGGVGDEDTLFSALLQLAPGFTLAAQQRIAKGQNKDHKRIGHITVQNSVISLKRDACETRL